MRQFTSSPLALALFFAFISFQAKALPFFGGSPLRNTIMNAHASSSGIIDLKKDDYSNGTFYVEADLSSSYNPRSSSSNSSNLQVTVDSVKMMISIANSETLVATNCLSFNYYDCNRYSCSIYGAAKPIDFPTFSANVTYGRSFVYLDYNYWGLNYDFLYYAQSCDTRSFPATGTERSGVIGLGTGNGAKDDFTKNPIFSIQIDSDLTKGKLIFWKDRSSTPLHTISANGTWQVEATSSYIETPNAAVAFRGNIMFDINSDVIGLPYDVYTLFLSYFTKLPNISCLTSTYRPSCSTTQKLEDLYNLTLSINGEQITIPPKIYATLAGYSTTTQYFLFNFKATDPSMTGKSYVSPSFQNSVILGANFMSYYYTVFDATSGYNKIYLYLSGIQPAPQPSPTKWVGPGIVGAILLISICCCALKKKTTANSRTTATAPLNTTDFNTATQAPIVFNNTAPTYSYDATNYNYPGYNYSAQPQGVYQPYPQQQGGFYIPPPPAGDFQERSQQ